MAAYKSELHNYPHPRSLKVLEIISKRRGTVVGVNAAEAFCLVRQLKKKFDEYFNFQLKYLSRPRIGMDEGCYYNTFCHQVIRKNHQNMN